MYEVPFIQEVSDINISLFLGTDKLKMALRAQKVPGLWRRGPGLKQGIDFRVRSL